MTDFEVGDHVKVTIDAVVVDGGPGCICTDAHASTDEPVRIQRAYLKNPSIEVEKIEPPVEVFKPGDVVRAKGRFGGTYTLTTEGYVSHSTGYVWNDGPEWRDQEFTSKKYERVEV